MFTLVSVSLLLCINFYIKLIMAFEIVIYIETYDIFTPGTYLFIFFNPFIKKWV